MRGWSQSFPPDPRERPERSMQSTPLIAIDRIFDRSRLMLYSTRPESCLSTGLLNQLECIDWPKCSPVRNARFAMKRFACRLTRSNILRRSLENVNTAIPTLPFTTYTRQYKRTVLEADAKLITRERYCKTWIDCKPYTWTGSVRK